MRFCLCLNFAIMRAVSYHLLNIEPIISTYTRKFSFHPYLSNRECRNYLELIQSGSNQNASTHQDFEQVQIHKPASHHGISSPPII